MLYNPFEQVTQSSFRELIESGYADFVLQRFEWPDVKEKTGFLLTPYDDKESADRHGHQLGEKEGRALQLPQDADKIESLLATGSGYRIFLNRIKEENRPDGKHRYEAFEWEGLPPLGSDTVQTSLF